MGTTQRKLSAVRDSPQPEREPGPDLRDAVAESLDAMKWLSPSDEALRALAVRLAEQIEQAADRLAEASAILHDAEGNPDIYRRMKKLEAWCNTADVVTKLGPQLQAALTALGGTPATRKAFQTEAPIGGRLAHLRAGAPGAANPAR
jgi:hypothetical protein